jgi:hypothetical protein
MKITRRQLRQIINEETRIIQEDDEETEWDAVRSEMSSLGGILIAYGGEARGSDGRRIYFFPGGLDRNAVLNRVGPLGFKVVWRHDKGSSDWDKIPNMRLSGAIVGIDRK